MRTVNTSYIGKITIQSLRYYILDFRLTGSDTILLHQIDFDELALEYKETYNSSLPVPFVELGVLVDEDTDGGVPKGRVRVIVDDNRLQEIRAAVDTLSESDEIIYRCGWCGNIVDFDGAELHPQTRMHKINVLEKYKYSVTEERVHGACCTNGHD